jgi:Holliday junction resolvase-like predicted endonuclease
VSFDDWFWEGNVQAAVATHLAGEGWIIEASADTASRARGIDLLATKDGRTLAVEVKGYPSTTYARGAQQGMPKKTNPTNQAPKWFSQALVKAITSTDGEGGPEVAVAFPDHPRFRGLLARSEWALRRLTIGVYLVHEDGAVERLLDHRV